MEQLANDSFGRSVAFSTDGETDTYTVTDVAGLILALTFPAGVPQSQAYDSINALAPPSN